jgi:hypothetical protein
MCLGFVCSFFFFFFFFFFFSTVEERKAREKRMNLAVNSAVFSTDRHGDGWLRVDTHGEWQFNAGERLRDRIDSETLVLKTEEGARVLEPRFPDDLRAGRVLWLHGRAYILAAQTMTPRRSLSATRRHYHQHHHHSRGKGRRAPQQYTASHLQFLNETAESAALPASAHVTASNADLTHSATLIRESRVFDSLHRSLTRSEARAALSDLHKEMARVERQPSAIQTKFVGVSTARVRGNLEFVAQAEPHEAADLPLGSPRYIHDDAAAAAEPPLVSPISTASLVSSNELSPRGDRPSLTLRTSGRTSKRLQRVDSDYLERMLLESEDGEVPARLPQPAAAAATTDDSTSVAAEVDGAIAGAAAAGSKPVVPPLNTRDKSSPLLRLRRFLSPRSRSPESEEKRRLREGSSSPKTDLLRSTSSGSTDRDEKLAGTRRRSRSRNARSARRHSPRSPRTSSAGQLDDFRTPRDELVTPRSPRSPRKRSSPRDAGTAAARTSRSKSRSRSRSRSKSRGAGEGRVRRKRVATTDDATTRRSSARLSLSSSARRRADAINMPLSAVPVEEFKIAMMSRDGPVFTYDAIPTAAYSDLIVALVSFARRERLPMPDGCEVCIVDVDDGRRLGSMLETTLDDKAPFLFQRELNKSGVKYQYVFAPTHAFPRSEKVSPAPFLARRSSSPDIPLTSSLRIEGESASLPPMPENSAREDETLPPTPGRVSEVTSSPLPRSRLSIALADDNDSAQPLPPVPNDAPVRADSGRGIQAGSVKRLSGIFEAKSLVSANSTKQKRLSASSSGTASPATSPKRVVLSGATAVKPLHPMSPNAPAPPVMPPEDDSGAPPPLPTSDPDLLVTPGRAPPAPISMPLIDDDVGPAPPEPPMTARTMAVGGIVAEEKPKPRKKRSKSRSRQGRTSVTLSSGAVSAATTAAAAAATVTPAAPAAAPEPKPALKLATDAEQEEQRMRQAGVGAVFDAFKNDQKTLPSMPEVMKLLTENNHDANAVIALLKKRDIKASSEAAPTVSSSSSTTNWDVVEPARESRTFEEFAASMADAASTENAAQGRVKRLSLIFLRQSNNNSNTSSGPSSAKRN